MVKVCPQCLSAWAGGFQCEDCGAGLVDPFGKRAEGLPDEVWRYIRFQYGARRGMLVRVIAWLLGPAVGLVLLRIAIGLPSPWATLGAAGAVTTGAIVWAVIYFFATRAVAIWVVHRGRIHRGRLARAMLKRALR
jgi:hypothetical protein